MADHRRLDAICTYTGRAVRPLVPRADDIFIDDIAHSLANQCRFTGHTREFYSVAQHSLHVSQRCFNFPLEGLLHDASEAYLSDIASPVKREGSMVLYRGAEMDLKEAIWKHFELDGSLEAYREVKRADRIMLNAEARDLMPPEFTMSAEDKIDERDLIRLVPSDIVPWSCIRAEREFLKMYEELTGGL